MLDETLGPGRLTPWFQPVVSAATRALHRFEALVRYECADGTVVLPYELIPALEQAGESLRLFPMMLDASLAACRRWRDAGVPAGLAINVTTEDLRDDRLPDLVTAALAKHAVPASVLTLELSEQQLLIAGGAATESLARLRSRGLRIAIDDFGAGHSSLARLADVPVNELKIDRSLVMSADADPRRQIVLRGAVDLGHRLGLEVVAEGVEDEDVAGTVRAVGADCIQGYLFGKPMPLADVLARYAPPSAEAQPSTATRTINASTRASRSRDRGASCRRSRRIGPLAIGFAAGNSLVYLAWVLLQPGGTELNIWLGNLAYIPISVVGIALAVRAGRRTDGRVSQAWLLLGLALCSYLVGDVVQWFYESVLHRPALPGPADAGYLLFYPLAMASVLRFGRPLRDQAARRLLTVDVLTVTTGAGAVILRFVLTPALPGTESIPAALLASAYPLGDLLLLFAAAAGVIRGVDRSVRLPLQILIAAFTCFVLTDSLYVNMPDYNGTSPLNIGWIAALTGVMLAASAGGRPVEAVVDRPAVATQAVASLSRLPYVAVAATYVLLLLSEVGDSDWSQLLLILAVILAGVLVALRQHLASRVSRDLARAYDALSSCDELTGLSTRRHFLAEAERELALSLRASGADAGTALVLLDIDHFTAINERYGQQAGDQVLTSVAEACRNQLRQGDLLGRYGGDEIIALLPHSSIQTARSITSRIEHHLRGLCIDTATGPVVACISAGVAFVPAGEGLDEALVRVSAELQAAKKAGGLRPGERTEPTPVG